MNFSVAFEEAREAEFFFDEEGYHSLELYDGEPLPIYGTIKKMENYDNDESDNYENDNDEEIGRILGYTLYNDDDFWYRCDNLSGDCELIASAVCNKNGSISKRYLSAQSFKIFLLDRIEIVESYRGQGIASRIMEKLPQMLTFQFDAGETIFLCASDYVSAKQYGFDSDEYKQGTQKLIDFYKKFGYKLISNNVMFWKEIDKFPVQLFE